MAVGHVATNTGGNNKTAGTAVSLGSYSAAVGDTLIVIAGCDNLSGQTQALPEGAVTDSAGNTWTRLGFVSGGGGSGSHAVAAVFGCEVTNALVSGSITVTPNSGVAAKGFVVHKFTGLSLTIRGLNSGTSTAALATSAPLTGDLVVAATVLEGPTSDTWTPDSDTTNGSWSANASGGTTGGSALTNIAIRTQWKVVNASGTQTYNGSNSTGRDVARMIVALAPTPPPAGAPPPEQYVPKSAINFSTGVGRMTASQIDCVAMGPNFNPDLPPIVYHPGVASDAGDLTGIYLPGLQPIVHALTDLGFAIVAPTTLYTYGNATAQTAITNALTYARNTLGCSTKPAPMIGGSEGACDALTYAYVNPTLVSCVVGIIPVIDLAEMVEQNVFGLGQAVLDAWGVGALPLPAGADPNTTAHRATLATIPMQFWYSTNDEVSANITAFQAATGCDVRAVGPLGHTNAAVAASWPTDIARFIRKRCSVPLRRGDIS